MGFHRDIFFTKIPLGGHYRYKDLFQIFPLEMPGMPRSNHADHYPNIIEFTAPDATVKEWTEWKNINDLYSQAVAKLPRMEKILNLLCAFTNNRFFRYNASGEDFWCMPAPDEPTEEINYMSSKWGMPFYYFPELPSALTSVKQYSAQKHPDIRKKDYILYFTDNPILDRSASEPMVFPDAIDALFDEYFALDEETAFVVDTAVHHIAEAVELSKNKKTSALICLFMAMETMVNNEFKHIPVKRCETCHQQEHRVSMKYRTFLLAYVGGDPRNKKRFNAFYSLRSKILHTGERLKADRLFADVPPDELRDELTIGVEIMVAAKMTVIQWLLRHKEIGPLNLPDNQKKSKRFWSRILSWVSWAKFHPKI